METDRLLVNDVSKPKTVLPVSFTFRDLHYHIEKKKLFRPTEKAHLLKGVSGTTQPGTVLAIMGPSGAGKTTLLDVLAGRATKGKVSGGIYVNGQPRNMKTFRRISGYVMQDDSLIGDLTVAENLMFSAKLRLPSWSSKERSERVEEVIKQLGLWKVRDRKIGSQFSRGVSGGERRRTAIGVELLTQPSLLFLDEPTSGLDGASAYTVMKTIIDLSKTGCTLICTIHQPRNNIYALFDQLMLLASGQVTFSGNASEALPYFSRLNFRCEAQTNPADFMLDLINKDHNQAEGEIVDSAIPEEQREEAANTDFPKIFKESEYFAALKKDVKNSLDQDSTMIKSNQEIAKLSRWASPLWWQIVVLIHRDTVSNFRSASIIWIRLFQCVLMALLVGSIFFQASDDCDGITPRASSLFFICTFSVLSSFAGLPHFIEERGRFNREIQSNMYGTFSYFISALISFAPLLIVFSGVFGSIAYLLIDFQLTWEKYGMFFLITTCLAFVGDSLCKAISALVPTFSIANAVASVLLTFFMLFCGFFTKSNPLPAFWTWAPYISPFKYSYGALMYNEFSNLSFNCSLPSTVPLPIPLHNVTSVMVPGTTVLDNYLGISDVNIWEYIGILSGMWGVFMVLQFLFLLFCNKESR